MSAKNALGLSSANYELLYNKILFYPGDLRHYKGRLGEVFG